MRISDWSSDVCSSDLSTIVAAWRAPEREARDRWIVIALLLAGALAVAILVLRAMSVAHVLALPGTAWLLLATFQHIQGWSRAVARILVTASVAILLTPAGLCGAWILIASGAADKEQPETVNFWTAARSEEHTSELQSLMRRSYDGLCM